MRALLLVAGCAVAVLVILTRATRGPESDGLIVEPSATAEQLEHREELEDLDVAREFDRRKSSESAVPHLPPSVPDPLQGPFFLEPFEEREVALRVLVLEEKSESSRVPLPGVPVRVVSSEVVLGVTNEEGHVDYRGPIETFGEERQVEVRARGYTRDSRHLSISRGAMQLILRVRAIGRVNGTVGAPSGESPGSIAVAVFVDDERVEFDEDEGGPVPAELVNNSAVARTWCDARGEFSFRDLHAGPRRVAATLDGVRWRASERLEIGCGTEHTVRIELDAGPRPPQPERAAVEGVVVDSQGKPVPGAAVNYRSPNGSFGGTSTNASGRFRVRGILGVALEIEVTGPTPQLGDAKGALVPGGEEVTLTLPSAPVLVVHFECEDNRTFGWRLVDADGETLEQRVRQTPSVVRLRWPESAARIEWVGNSAGEFLLLPPRPFEGERELTAVVPPEID